MKRALFGAAAAVLAAGAAQAQVPQGLQVGVEGYRYAYQERFEGEEINDRGTFFGGSAEYGAATRAWSFGGRLRAAKGSVDYEAGSARIEDVEQLTVQLELLAGRRFAVGEMGQAAIYAGLGGRNLRDYSGGEVASDGGLGYDRELEYAYVPLGVSLAQPAGGGEVVFHAQYNWLVGGSVRSEFSGIDPELPDVEVELDQGHGFDVGAQWTSAGGFGVGPFLRFWDVKRSSSFVLADEEGQIELFEPPNTTWELGVRLSYAFGGRR